MTREFALGFGRKEFGQPLPVSESLLAIADRSVSDVIESGWTNSIDFNDPRSLTECWMPVRAYDVPPLSEITKRATELGASILYDFSTSSVHEEISGYEKYRRSSKFNNVAHPARPEMSADEVIALSLWNDGWLYTRINQPSIMSFYGPHFGFLGRPEVSEITPLFFSDIARIGTTIWPHFEFTVAECLHPLSRFPQCLPHQESTPRVDALHFMMNVGAEEMRAAAPISWMSHMMLVLHQLWLSPLSDRDALTTESLVRMAVQFAESGYEVEELQPYVAHIGLEPELIVDAMSNGIGLDMLGALKSARLD